MGLINYIFNSDGRRSLKKLDKMASRVEALEQKYAAMSDAQLRSQTNVLKDRLKAGETLDDILYDAFAVVREAAWRVLKLKHYHVQIIGGICLHQGRIAEMKTGEGKTLVATLPAYLNALAGKGVHIVTVNDYLAKRDAEWMGKVHKFLGLTVGVVVPGMDDAQKQVAYNCDITYATNNELGFDYLRDNLKTDLKRMVQRDLDFAIVDEVDSILIDEARTPLIISGKGDKSSELYERVDKFVRTLEGGFDDEGAQGEEDKDSKKKRKKAAEEEEEPEEESKYGDYDDIAKGAKYGDWDYVIDRKDRTVQITEKGAAKAERFFNIENLGDIENASLNHHIQQALKAHKLFHRDEDYIVNDDEVIIVDEFTGRLMIGRRYSDGLHQAIEAKEGVKVRNENKTYATITFQNFFRLYKKLSGMTGTAKTEEGEFRTIYSLDVLEIPTNRPVIRKDMPDAVYATVDGKKRALLKEITERHEKGQPILIGTATVEKSEEIAKMLRKNGIKHNILNAKNHEREAEIVAQAGRLGAVTIATNMAGRGTDILLGGNPEYLAKKRMREEGVKHEMIELATSYAELEGEAEEQRKKYRAMYDELYAKYKAETDAEKVEVVKAGGLCILGTERHESRRIDNQLRGRSGRQGDPGTSRFFISLEDDLAKFFGGERLTKMFELLKVEEDEEISAGLVSKSIEMAQKRVEGRNFSVRKHVLEYDDVMNKQREIMYGERNKVLNNESVHEKILSMIQSAVAEVIDESIDRAQDYADWDIERFNKNIDAYLLPPGSNFVTVKRAEAWGIEYLEEKLYEAVCKAYEEKIVRYREGGIDFYEVERVLLLKIVDNKWIDHIDAMDQLRRGISLRAYGNQDPVIAYKKEGFEMFDYMTERIRCEAGRLLLKVELQAIPEKKSKLAEASTGPQGPKKAEKKVGPNDPCPCGSGKKYKHCCGKN